MNAVPAPEALEQPVFYYDLADPRCYLLAEQILSALPEMGGRVPEFEPVLAGDLGAEVGDPDRPRLERLASDAGIQPLRWPAGWPPESREAMLAATYAKRIGRVVAFSLAAFRQAFAGGRDLGDRDTILIAGAACEMHPSALLKGIETRSVADALARAGARARGAGATSLPAIEVRGSVFHGENAIAEVTEALR